MRADAVQALLGCEAQKAAERNLLTETEALAREGDLLREQVRGARAMEHQARRYADDGLRCNSELRSECEDLQERVSDALAAEVRACQQAEAGKTAEADANCRIRELQHEMPILRALVNSTVQKEHDIHALSQEEEQRSKDLQGECEIMAERIATMVSTEHEAGKSIESGLRIRRHLQHECVQLREQLKHVEAQRRTRTSAASELLKKISEVCIDPLHTKKQRMHAIDSCKAHLQQEWLRRNQRMDSLCKDLAKSTSKIATSAALAAQDSEILLNAKNAPLVHKFHMDRLHEEFNMHVQEELLHRNQDLQHACESLHDLVAEVADAAASNTKDSEVFCRIAGLQWEDAHLKEQAEGRTRVLEDLLRTNQKLQHEGERLRQLAGNVAVAAALADCDTDSLLAAGGSTHQQECARDVNECRSHELTGLVSCRQQFQNGRERVQQPSPSPRTAAEPFFPVEDQGPGADLGGSPSTPSQFGRLTAAASGTSSSAVARAGSPARTSQAETLQSLAPARSWVAAPARIGGVGRTSTEASASAAPQEDWRGISMRPSHTRVGLPTDCRPGDALIANVGGYPCNLDGLHPDERLRRSQHLKRACELFREEAGLIMEAEKESCRSAQEGGAADGGGVSQTWIAPCPTTLGINMHVLNSGA